MAKVSHKIALKSLKIDWNGVDPEKGLPERLKIFGWGRNETLKGPVVVDKDSLAVFEGNQRKLGRETCAIDFNHGTVDGSEAFLAARGNPDIAGYFRPRIIEGEGLFMENVSTTPTGMSKAADFKDLSPTPLVDEATGRLIGLHSVALTPTGAVDGLTIESAALKAMSATFKTLSVSLIDTTTKDKSKPAGYANGEPDYYPQLDEEIMKPEQMTELRSKMGVSDSMSWDELFPLVMAKVGAGKQGPITPDASSQVVKWPSGFDYKAMQAEMTGTMEAALKPLTAKIGELEGELATKRKEMDKQHKDTILAEAGKANKVITLSADVLDKMDVATLTAVVAAIPVANVPTRPTMRVLNAPNKVKLTRADSARLIQEQVDNALARNSN